MKDLNWRLLNFTVNRGSMNMAIDEAIFRCFDGVNTLRLYGWNPSAVSIGKHQKIFDEVNLNSLRELNFDCVRRISGGGAVFHDEGELTYSIVTNLSNTKTDTIEGIYYEISEIIFQPLEKLGLSLNYEQIHCPSVFSNGKKISGNAQARYKDIILQHGTILVKFRPEIMYSVLKARAGRTRENMIESVYQHVTTLTESLNKDLSPQNVAEYLIHYLIKTSLPQSFIGELTIKEQQMAEELASVKYESEDWLYKYM